MGFKIGELVEVGFSNQRPSQVVVLVPNEGNREAPQREDFQRVIQMNVVKLVVANSQRVAKGKKNRLAQRKSSSRNTVRDRKVLEERWRARSVMGRGL